MAVGGGGCCYSGRIKNDVAYEKISFLESSFSWCLYFFPLDHLLNLALATASPQLTD